MMAPVPAPDAPPPRVPFSRVESGSPEHALTSSNAAAANIAVATDFVTRIEVTSVRPRAVSRTLKSRLQPSRHKRAGSMPTKSLQIRLRTVLYIVRVTKDVRESNCVAGKSGDGKRLQVSKNNNGSRSRWGINAKNPLAALDESSVVVAGPLRGER